MQELSDENTEQHHSELLQSWILSVLRFFRHVPFKWKTCLKQSKNILRLIKLNRQ